MGAFRDYVRDSAFRLLERLTFEAAADLATDDNSDDYNQALVDMCCRLLDLGPDERARVAYLIGIKNERLAALFNQPVRKRPDLPDTRRS